MNLAPGVVVPIPTCVLFLTVKAGVLSLFKIFKATDESSLPSPTTINLAPGAVVSIPTLPLSLTLNADGNATWQAASTGSGTGSSSSEWITIGDNIAAANTGNVGVGTQTPGARFMVVGADGAPTLSLIHISEPTRPY